MAGLGICILCYADTCTSEVHSVFNPVAPYRYRFPTMYLYMAAIANPLVCVLFVGHGFVSTSSTFMRSSTSHPVGPHGRLAKNGKSGVEDFDTICTAPCQNRCDSSTTCRLGRLDQGDSAPSLQGT